MEITPSSRLFPAAKFKKVTAKIKNVAVSASFRQPKIYLRAANRNAIAAKVKKVGVNFKKVGAKVKKVAVNASFPQPKIYLRAANRNVIGANFKKTGAKVKKVGPKIKSDVVNASIRLAKICIPRAGVSFRKVKDCLSHESATCVDIKTVVNLR